MSNGLSFYLVIIEISSGEESMDEDSISCLNGELLSIILKVNDFSTSFVLQ